MSEEILEKEALPQKPKLSKLAPEKALPQSGHDKLIKIIKGYAVASNGGETQVNYKDVAGVTGLNATIVSGNNAFLSESQFISSPKYGFYLPSEGAVRFARESAWGEDQAKSHLRKIIGITWYGTVTVQNFALRSSLTRDDLKRSLALKCGATEGDAANLDRLIGFIIYTGLVAETEEGLLVRGNTDDVETLPTILPQSKPILILDAKKESQKYAPLPVRDLSENISLTVHIHFHSLDEMTEENALRMKNWLKVLNGSGQAPTVEINHDVEKLQS